MFVRRYNNQLVRYFSVPEVDVTDVKKALEKCKKYLIPDKNNPNYDKELDVLVIEDFETKMAVWPYIKNVLLFAYQTSKELKDKHWYGAPKEDKKAPTKFLCFKIAYNKDSNPRAVATYEGRLGGRKGTGIGREKIIYGTVDYPVYKQEGLDAFVNIIKHDIKNQLQWYWSEVSGSVKDRFLENGAIPIPNNFASQILKKDLEPLSDGYSYVRPLGPQNIDTEKMIVGFPNEQIYIQVVRDLTENNPLIDEENKLSLSINMDSTTPDIFPDDMDWAMFMIANIGELILDQDYDTILQEWEEYLDESIEILKSYLNDKKYYEICHQFIDNALTYKDITTVLSCHLLKPEMLS